MRVLIVEDEPQIAKSLKRGLEKQGYAADTVADGEIAENRLSMYRDDYDMVLLDLMLPGMDGMTILEQARKRGVKTPVLVLTGRDMVDDKVAALNVGADDYLVKPFSFTELSARMRALLRRPEETPVEELRYKDIHMNLATQVAYRVSQDSELPGEDVSTEREQLDLTLKEFSLLEYLIRNQDRTVRRGEIVANVWDFESDSFSNFLDVHMKNLRRKLGTRGEDIETVRGIGYRLR